MAVKNTNSLYIRCMNNLYRDPLILSKCHAIDKCLVASDITLVASWLSPSRIRLRWIHLVLCWRSSWYCTLWGCIEVIKSCFVVSQDILFTFGAELVAFILAIENTWGFKWHNLLIEYDLIYVMNLFKIKSDKNPRKFYSWWLCFLPYAEDLVVNISHNFYEANGIIVKLVNHSI